MRVSFYLSDRGGFLKEAQAFEEFKRTGRNAYSTV
jgi:hypothetical protein